MTEVAEEIPVKVQRRAKALKKEAIEAASGTRRSPLWLGWIGAEAKSEGLIVAMGFESETDFRKFLRIGRSTWFRYTKLAEGLHKLPKEEFLKLTAENADHLIKLPEEQRYGKELIKKAQELNEEDFEKYILKFRAQEEQTEEGEVIVQLKWRMPESRRAVILDTIKWFAEFYDLDVNDESRNLELLCAEIRFRNPVVTGIMRATAQLREAHEMLTGKAGNLSADEIMSKVDAVVGQVIRGMAEAAGPTVQ